MTTVGVLALQGDVREHLHTLESLGVAAAPVKTPDQLGAVDALVIPGGESTTIGKMAVRFGLIEPLRRSIEDGLPTYGTCAGLILLAGAVTDGDQPLLGRPGRRRATQRLRPAERVVRIGSRSRRPG